MGETAETYDVIILGSGISGSVLGAIMASKGYRVIIVDGGTHPRFAIGESTIPQTSQVISMLAREHKIREFENIGLGAPAGLRAQIGNSSGVKKSFGFCFHEAGKEFDPAHGNMYGNIWRDEQHLFRQDVDAYLFHVAIGYGCEVRQNCMVSDVELDDSGVAIGLPGGERLRGRFIVDGTGARSILADHLGLREEPTSLKTRTRGMFTHMMGVKPFEECAESPYNVGWSEGTTHHIFEGGWFWVIPFNNWEGATNPLISVGLTLDIDAYPARDDISPDEEFQSFLQRLPSVAKQFEDSKLVRPWVRVPRLQYSSTRTVGDRFCLMSNTAGFVDPLFSRGLINTFEVIRSLVPNLCTALDDDRFSKQQFEAVDALQKRSFDFADRLIFGAYTSWRDYDLWNAWLRPWAIGLHALESVMGSHLMMGKLSRFKLVDDPISSDFEPVGFRIFFESAFAVIDKVASGEVSTKLATEELWELIAAYEYEIPLPDAKFTGHEMAFKTAECKEIFLGIPELHERWTNDLKSPE